MGLEWSFRFFFVQLNVRNRMVDEMIILISILFPSLRTKQGCGGYVSYIICLSARKNVHFFSLEGHIRLKSKGPSL